MTSHLPFSTLILHMHVPYPPKPLNVHVLSVSSTNINVTYFTNCPVLWVTCSLHLLPSPFPLTLKLPIQFQFSQSVVSDSLQPHELQHARPPCPSPTPGACSNSCPLSWWCHPTFSSSVVPFSSHLQSFPSWGSFPMSQFFASSSQSIGASASTSVLPMIIHDWFPLGLTVLISFQSKGLSRVFSNTTAQKHQFFTIQLSLWSNSHIHTWLLEKPWLWLVRPLSAK